MNKINILLNAKYGPSPAMVLSIFNKLYLIDKNIHISFIDCNGSTFVSLNPTLNRLLKGSVRIEIRIDHMDNKKQCTLNSLIKKYKKRFSTFEVKGDSFRKIFVVKFSEIFNILSETEKTLYLSYSLLFFIKEKFFNRNYFTRTVERLYFRKSQLKNLKGNLLPILTFNTCIDHSNMNNSNYENLLKICKAFDLEYSFFKKHGGYIKYKSLNKDYLSSILLYNKINKLIELYDD